MARYIQRPENALKRANEFIDVGKPARALDTLQEVFRNKKWTYTWSESIIEPIMFKYLDLCVELKKSHIAKEGLFQYRNMFQLVNVGSLENVIRGYLRMAEERTDKAQQQSSQAVLDIDDLDNLATPESILMSAVCGEDAQDRSDRTILLPWVKFLWESYCQCLELLRVNTHCENLYHDIARMAFQFCLKYNRKMEFRKLCEKLRKHLEDICKSSNQSTGVSISKPETQQLNLDTRLHQLDSAIQMELWQEAYKAIEDIHGLMTMSKKTPVAKTMANYYQKLAMVFWKAGNQLFHAAALLKLFQLTREMKKNITADELQRMASHVLVSTLAIPLPSAHPEFDRFIETDKSPLEKAQRLAVLLGLQQPPSRVSLLKDMVRFNVVQLASPQFQDLHKWLEQEFDPLSLCTRVQFVIDHINSDENGLLKQYITAVQDVTLVRLIRQVCQVYQSIEFTRLLELAIFTDAFYLEKLLVDCVRHNDMQIRIDHRKRCIHFGTDLSESQREDHPDGPVLQSMPSEQIRSQLVNMSTVLHRAIAAINPLRKTTERKKLCALMVQNYHENKVKEHQRILQRQKIIEDRKEFIERLNTEREEEELRRQEEINRQHKLAEQKRLEFEMEERERKRHENEIAQIKEKSFKEKMQQISQTVHGQKVLKKMDNEDIKKMDAEQIAAREAEELLKERKEVQSKLKSQEKKIDYLERAKRIEEIPLIEKFLAEKEVQDKEFWEKQEATRIEMAIAERKNAVTQQDRLQRLYTDRDVFLDKLRSERNSLYVEKLKSFNVLLEEEKIKRLAKRVVQRREERRQNWLKEKEDENKRREDEIRKAKEEEERIEKERRAKEREAEQEKLRIQSEKQRVKEEEAERKIQEDRENIARMTQREKDNWRSGTEPNQPQRGDNDWRNARSTEQQPTSQPKQSDVWKPRLREMDARPINPRDEWRRNAAEGKKDDRVENKRSGDKDEREIRRNDDREGQTDRRRVIDRSDNKDFRRNDDRRNDDRRNDDRRSDDRFASRREPREAVDRSENRDWRSRNEDSREMKRGGNERFEKTGTERVDRNNERGERNNDRGERNNDRGDRNNERAGWRSDRTKDEGKKEIPPQKDQAAATDEEEWTSVKKR